MTLTNNLSIEVFVNNDDGLEQFCKTTQIYSKFTFNPLMPGGNKKVTHT